MAGITVFLSYPKLSYIQKIIVATALLLLPGSAVYFRSVRTKYRFYF
jgi:hypothetical protein